jgi:hypothetical protein
VPLRLGVRGVTLNNLSTDLLPELVLVVQNVPRSQVALL